MNHEESEIQPPKVQRVASDEFDLNSLERDPGKRLQIWQYHPNQRDEVRRAYLKWVHIKSILTIILYLVRSIQDDFNMLGLVFFLHVGACLDLLNQASHIQNVIEDHTSEEIQKNRFRLKSSIDATHWLTFQACAFRGHDETPESKNRGNFLEMIKLIASYNDEVARTVLENAPYNAKYTSHQIQKEILHILSNKVRKHICEEIGDSKFCIVVDVARDESKREQMALVLRFVDIHGFIQERFLDLVHVKDTTSLTLKQELCGILSRHGLDVSNIRGQGYDGASNMRGEWNGKRHDELHAAKTDEIVHLLEIDELETGKGANQIGTLKRAGDTRWSSHFSSVCSLINMYGATLTVLQKIIVDGSTYSQRGDADSAYNTLTSFEFVLILHLMKDMMGITDILCQVLQKQSQDIINAVQLVHSTKTLIQSMRDDRWEELLKNVKSFCEQHDILIPDLTASYVARQGRSRHQKDHITVEHYFRVEIFLVTIDKQLQELNSRFNDQAMDLLSLSSTLMPKDAYKNFDIAKISTLVDILSRRLY
ncbi:Zinc finger MYM-type protein [Arachis hypogaea]|nr:Zinc finger MYM-type protein [Arachis hypogaea]